MTLEELYEAANKLCQQHWNCDYTDEIRLVNRRWLSYMAYFRINRHDETFIPRIVMSKKNNEIYSEEIVLGNLLHELVHWRLYKLGLPFGDEDREFVMECIRVGAPFSKATSAQKAAIKYACEGDIILFANLYNEGQIPLWFKL